MVSNKDAASETVCLILHSVPWLPLILAIM